MVGPLGVRRCVVVRGRAALGGRGGGGRQLHPSEPVAFLWDREAGWIFLALGRVLRGGDRVRALLAPSDLLRDVGRVVLDGGNREAGQVVREEAGLVVLAVGGAVAAVLLVFRAALVS